MKRDRQSESKRPETPCGTRMVPPEIAAVIDDVTSDDRRWFEKHPGAEYRTRPAAPGEFWPVFDSASVLYVIVMQFRPGWRLRVPVVLLNLPESEWIQ